MRVVAVVPLKLTNRRFPNKNTRAFTNGEPLCKYILHTLLAVKGIDAVYAYCSDDSIKFCLPAGVCFLKRPDTLDQDSTKINEVLSCFAQQVPAEIYVLAHATAPFLRPASIEQGLNHVLTGENDSAFAVRKLQDFLWNEQGPINYALNAIPRTQDLPVLYEETSGFYIYSSDLILKEGRRIGKKPWMVIVDKIESSDIDEEQDFLIADAIYNHILRGQE